MKKKAKAKIEKVASGLNDLETPIRQACNLAKALLIMSSGENMPPDESEGLFGVAETLVELIEGLQGNAMRTLAPCPRRREGRCGMNNVVEFPTTDRPITESEIAELHSRAFRDLEGEVCDLERMV